MSMAVTSEKLHEILLLLSVWLQKEEASMKEIQLLKLLILIEEYVISILQFKTILRMYLRIKITLYLHN
jgi:hypothetical protein